MQDDANNQFRWTEPSGDNASVVRLQIHTVYIHVRNSKRPYKEQYPLYGLLLFMHIEKGPHDMRYLPPDERDADLIAPSI